MIATAGISDSAAGRVAFAAALALAPATAHAESPDLPMASQAAESSSYGTESRPPAIVVGRAMDLVGTPMSMVPKNRPIPLLAGGRFVGGAASLPSGAPIGSNRITSGFGYRSHPILGGYRLHSGLDMAAPTGSRVYATMDGYVSHADWAGGYGLSVRLNGGNSVETRYGHLSGLAVGAGTFVRKGDLLGYVGSTGQSTGPHLHYEVRVNGRPIDPRSVGRK